MTASLYFLVITYSAVALLLVLMLLYSKLPWLFKLSLTLALPVIYWMSYTGWVNSQGWPASIPIPEKFLLHAAVIDEPDESLGTKGAIDLWATDLKDSHPASSPRAYHMRYTQELHSTVDDALRTMRNGKLQLGIRTTRSADSKAPPKDFSKLGNQEFDVEFIAQPDPALPEK